MLQPIFVRQQYDLEQILLLQHKNLARNITDNESRAEGFVTLHHNLAILEQMHQIAPSVIIKDKGQVIAYALTMLRDCRELIPDLETMFSLFDTLYWNDQLLTHYRFYVMGQICIDKPYRGVGLVEMLYSFHKQHYSQSFELIVTEIATRNTRSLRAHEKIGFRTIHVYRDELDEWAVVVWDWS